MKLKEFDYLFDLNGYFILRNVINKNDIKKANQKLSQVEKKNQMNYPIMFFWKKENDKDLYISNILELDKLFEKFAVNPIFLKLIKRVTGNSDFYRLNHAVAMTKLKKYLHIFTYG